MGINIETSNVVIGIGRISIDQSEQLQELAENTYLFTTEGETIVDIAYFQSVQDDVNPQQADLKVVDILKDIGITPAQFQSVKYLCLSV